MSTRRRCGQPVRLEGLRQRFERWRGTRQGRSRIPDSLWASAVKMVGVCGIHRTAKTLRLNYYALKKRFEEKGAAVPRVSVKGAVATFVELAAPAGHGFAAIPAGPCECSVELEDIGGAKMRVHLKGSETPDLAALSRSFWNPAP